MIRIRRYNYMTNISGYTATNRDDVIESARESCVVRKRIQAQSQTGFKTFESEYK